MVFLVLGKGKTGSLVTQVARERGHSVRVLDVAENSHASALTAPNLAGVDVAIDFTTADAALENMRAILSLGCRIVVGTTGWYKHLTDMHALAERRGGSLLYGTNFSIGVQTFFRLTDELARLHGYTFAIEETHHQSKLDAPSGTAITLQQIVEAEQKKTGVDAEVEVRSRRVGDAKGEHVVTATGPDDVIQIRHDAHSRRGFALGAVRAAEWLAHHPGIYDFREVFDKL
jgi:4-hydroxy-tetrahydrodipicolinate reductase